MSSELLGAIAGMLLSLLFSYIPGASAWYGKFDGTQKRLFMLALLLLAAAGSFGLVCSGWSFGLELTCDQAGVQTLIETFVFALVSNQGTFLISPKAKSAPKWDIG